MSTARDLRERVAALVREYYREQFASRPFVPGTDLVHYAGRVFDEEELCNARGRQPRLLPDRQSVRGSDSSATSRTTWASPMRSW